MGGKERLKESKNTRSKREVIKKVDEKQENFFTDAIDAIVEFIFPSNTVAAKKSTTAGDPVNVATGSFYVEATDLEIEDRGMDVLIKRRYNSTDKSIGSMGKGWSFEFDSHLQIKGEGITLTYPDGHIKEFKKIGQLWKNQIDEDESESLMNDSSAEGFILKTMEKYIYKYDKKGKLISISDKNGNLTSVRYNNKGEIDSIISPGGKILSFVCKSGKVNEIIDNIGRKLVYKYEGDNLTEVTFPNEGTVKYTYDNGLITQITDQNGITYIRNEYDDNGRVLKQYDSDGNVTEIEYDDKKKENTFTYLATGVVEKYRYNERSLLSEKIYKDGTSQKYTYDKYCNINSETDRNGNTVNRTYDSKGNLLLEVYPNGYRIKNEYDSDANLIETTTSGGTETLYKYDDKGNLKEEHVKLDEKEYAVAKYKYDSYGRMISRTDPEGNTTELEYEENHINKPTTIKDQEGNIFRYTYDKAGRMLSITASYGTVKFSYNEMNKKVGITDAEGNVTKLEYDKVGNLIRKVFPTGQESGECYKYRYDAMDRLMQAMDPVKNVFALKYDAHGNLIKEINPNYYDSKAGDGVGVEYKYDESNRKTMTIYPTGGVARIEYDPAGNIIKTVGPVKEDDDSGSGSGSQYEYDEMNRLTKITDPEGNTFKEFEYDDEGRIIKEINAKGVATLLKYNCAGWLLERRVPVDEKAGMILYNVTQYLYDKAGRKTEERISPEYVDETSYPKHWNSINYTYDRIGRIVKISDTTGAGVEYAYDCLGNRTFEKLKINESKSKITRYRYTSMGWLEKKTEEIDGEDLTERIDGKAIAQTVYEYDGNGNVIKITTPKGYITILSYDASDRLVEVTREEGKDNKRTTTYEYDCAGNLTKETDCNGNSIKYDYDSMNRQIRITDKEGSITRLFYDERGNVIKHVTPQNYNPEEDDGSGTKYKYDYLNRLIEITNALGITVQRNKYNASGELVEKIDASQKGIEFKYDIGGRIKELITPGALKKGIAAQQYTYDAFGNITGIKDGEGNYTGHSLDLWGRITEVNKADGSTEKYTYDYAGNIISSTDGNGNTTEYEYNSLNLLSQITDPVGDRIAYKYDLQGRIARKADRNRKITEYIYNLDDSLVARKDIATGTMEEFTYNMDGTLSTASSAGMVYTYDYTQGMRLKSKKANGKPLLEYKYDKDSNVIELKDITGRRIQYKYDILGRMQEVWDKNKKEAEYKYNPDGTIASICFANGINVEYNHDEDKNLTGILAKDREGTEVLKHSYVYDNNGNQIEREENGEITRYIYDRLNRLSKVSYSDAEEEFEYDLAGNRIKRTFKNITTNYDYDRRNRLIEKVEGGAHTAYQYDPQGNLLAESGRRGTTKYTYDCFNRTASVQSAGGGYVKNRYDPEGLRFEVQENGSLSRFIFSGREVVTEHDANYRLKAAIIRGHEILAQKDIRDSSYYYFNNAHGDVTALLDSKGEVVNSYKYDAFGNTVEAVEKVHNRFRYAGEQFDAVTGQYYLRARFYNPVVGRFTQEDTYRGDGLNLYSYVKNNPVKYIDPSGFCGETKAAPMKEAKPAGKKGAGGIQVPKDPAEQKAVLDELQGLTSHELDVDKNGYVYIKKEAGPGSKTPKGDELIDRMANGDKTCTIEIAKKGKGNYEVDVNSANAINGKGSDTKVYFDPSADPNIKTIDPKTGQVGPAKRPDKIGLGHEMIHADRSMRGSAVDYSTKADHTYTDSSGKKITQSVPAEELATVGLSGNNKGDITENDLRAEQGLNKRGAY